MSRFALITSRIYGPSLTEVALTLWLQNVAQRQRSLLFLLGNYAPRVVGDEVLNIFQVLRLVYIYIYILYISSLKTERKEDGSQCLLTLLQFQGHSLVFGMFPFRRLFRNKPNKVSVIAAFCLIKEVLVVAAVLISFSAVMDLAGFTSLVILETDDLYFLHLCCNGCVHCCRFSRL